MLEIREAEVRGRLYEGPGYPFLEVPEGDVLAEGTADPLADAATEARLCVSPGSFRRPVAASGAPGAWGIVHGEVLTFDDPDDRLPAIDRLEDFNPWGSSVYRRVLVHVTLKGVTALAWLYTIEASGIHGRRIVSGRWPE